MNNNVIITTYDELKKLREGFIEDAVALIEQRTAEAQPTLAGMITRKEAANILRCNDTAVRYKAQHGLLTEKKIGGRYYYNRKEVEALASLN